MAKVRVHELAREFGVTSKVVLKALEDLGVFVKSPSSQLEASTVRRLTQELRTETTGASYRRQAANMFGVAPDQIKMRRQVPRRGGQETSSKPIDEWPARFFEPAEKRAWMEAGLSEHDARIADRCRQSGLTPGDLAVRVDGVRAGARLRGGESVASVRIRIDEMRRRQSQAS